MSNFQYLPIVFSGPNGAVTNPASNVNSNALTPAIYSPVGLDSLVLFGSVAVSAFSPAVFTASAATDLLTVTAHGYSTGLVVQVSNSGGALPTGLSASTNYYVIKNDANTFFLATSLANANNAVHINLTGDGTGTNTATPASLSASMELQGGFNYNDTWAAVPNSSVALTEAVDIVFELDYIRYQQYRVALTVAGGSVSFSNLQIGYKGGN